MMRAKKRKMREPFSDRLFNFGNTVFMLLIMVVVIYPVLNVIAISFSNANHIARADVTVFPRGFTTTSYEYILKDQQVWTGYLNSVFYALGSTFVSLLCTSLFAYPLTHNDFVAKRFLTIFLTVTMFFGGGMIPTYLLMRNIGLIDNPLVLIVPFSVAAYNVFVFRTFFQNIPRELMESAEIDGANDFTILFRIILPLSKALLATFGLFGIVGSWNSWFNALNYFHDGILEGSMSASYEDESYVQFAGVRCCVRVYERYSWSGGNRVSMTLTLVGDGEELFLSAITAGGSQGMLFKINTWGEEAFLDTLRELVERY